MRCNDRTASSEVGGTEVGFGQGFMRYDFSSSSLLLPGY